MDVENYENCFFYGVIAAVSGTAALSSSAKDCYVEHGLGAWNTFIDLTIDGLTVLGMGLNHRVISIPGTDATVEISDLAYHTDEDINQRAIGGTVACNIVLKNSP